MKDAWKDAPLPNKDNEGRGIINWYVQMIYCYNLDPKLIFIYFLEKSNLIPPTPGHKILRLKKDNINSNNLFLVLTSHSFPHPSQYVLLHIKF